MQPRVQAVIWPWQWRHAPSATAPPCHACSHPKPKPLQRSSIRGKDCHVPKQASSSPGGTSVLECSGGTTPTDNKCVGSGPRFPTGQVTPADPRNPTPNSTHLCNGNHQVVLDITVRWLAKPGTGSEAHTPHKHSHQAPTQGLAVGIGGKGSTHNRPMPALQPTARPHTHLSVPVWKIPSFSMISCMSVQP
jgi:hypothetical protein